LAADPTDALAAESVEGDLRPRLLGIVDIFL
jgi:hypothetical protein